MGRLLPCWIYTLHVFLSLISLSEPFSNNLKLQHRKCHQRSTTTLSPTIRLTFTGKGKRVEQTSRRFASQDDEPVTVTPINAEKSLDDLNCEIKRLCQEGDVDDALKLLNQAEDRMINNENAGSNSDTGPIPDHRSYTTLMQAWASRDDTAVPERLEPLLERMKDLSNKYPACTPTALAYNAVILTWSKASRRLSGKRCEELIQELWSKYNETSNSDYLPLRVTYVSTLAAWASSGRGREAATRAEALFEEMEGLRLVHPHLSPTTICANIVLNAWSKSGARGAAHRCQQILNRMESLYFAGQVELKPNTTSFNTVIDALARSRERGSEQKAESLLEHMDELSSSVEELRYFCKPDEMSFNTVLNSWARSPVEGAARRAEEILRHMERRYMDGNTDIQPDAATYNTVLTAWARSKDIDAADRAEQVLRRMESATHSGNFLARPNAISYNIYINVLAKSIDPRASDRAMETLSQMKKLGEQEGREDCWPDVFTYTSLLDALAKRGSREAAETAETVLEELETSYRQTGDSSLKPNIRTYTSVVHAIARSRTLPERAERIVNRLERMYETGDGDIQPDVVCYDALINAFGWSNQKGKSLKCFEIYQKMLHLYKSRKNPDVKPDIITCNSILNACAYDDAETAAEHAVIMNVTVQTLEDFQSRAPTFGRPNHITYANTLRSIEKHMSANSGNEDDCKRSDLAEATFWQCCQSGGVSVLVVTNLALVLPWNRLKKMLGPALMSGDGENLRFSCRKLPVEWTQYAPQPKERRDSRPSRKQYAAPVTKSAMASRRRDSSS